MSIFDKKRVKVAAKGKTEIPLNSHVITTNDIGVVMPIFCRMTFPGDDFKLNISSFSRLAPMPVPTYSNIKVINRAFYVKMRSLWKPFDDFYSGRHFYFQNQMLQFDECPNVPNHVLASIFCEFPYSELYQNGVPDFKWNGGLTAETSDNTPRRFTTLGKRLYSFLKCLGISINFCYQDTEKISLLPLLAYMRVFYDYYLPSRFSDISDLRKLFTRYDWTYNADNEHDLERIREVASNLLKIMYAYFDNDYFTSSWVSPNAPSNNYGIVEVSIPDQTRALFEDPDDYNVITNNAVFERKYGSYFSRSNSPDDAGSLITSFGLTALQRVYDWGMRRGLSGNKYFESIFAQFGIKLPEVQLDKSIFLGSDVSYVKTSDVMATAQTDVGGSVTALGDYAGKGIQSSDSQSFSCDCNDFGYIIILSQIVPDTGYVQGRSRECKAVTRTQLFQPEFDCLGMQGLSNDELFADFKSPQEYADGLAYGGKADGIFGYVPRYSEYKVARDVLAGDFVIPHLSADLDSYHSFRMFEKPSQTFPLSNNQQFRIMDTSLNGNGFNRIFNDTNNDVDHFICEFGIFAKVYRKCKSIADSIELSDGGETVTLSESNFSD